MDYDMIHNSVKEINKKLKQYKKKEGNYKDLSKEEFEAKMKQEYNKFYEASPHIFNKTIIGTIDTTVFAYFIAKAKDMQKNKISKHDASVDIGQKLVDTFVKPHLNKK